MSSNQPTKKAPTAPWKTLTAGGVAGIVSRTCVSPLERLKILYQVQHITGHDAKAKYTTPVQALGTILREEGVAGYFRGNGANCVRVFPYTGVQFLSMNQYSTYWKQVTGRNQLSAFEKQFVGGFAGVTSVLVTYPMDMIRGRLTAQGGAVGMQYTGLVDATRKTFQQEGIRGLYAGISPTLIGIYPYVALNYTCYETLKEFAREDTFAWRVVAGSVAGTTGQTVAYPLDVLRRRFQLQSMPGNPLPEDKRYKNVLDALRKIYRAEGVRGYYKGFLINFVKTAPTIAIMFVCNDLVMDVLGR
ncbi:hypothetical protein BASA81_007294 [Batrachochytrium salamandrivorans]|nr:hypothetical protein BASA81_007294 [Batrachochytrium salamandrivorans]